MYQSPEHARCTGLSPAELVTYGWSLPTGCRQISHSSIAGAVAVSWALVAMSGFGQLSQRPSRIRHSSPLFLRTAVAAAMTTSSACEVIRLRSGSVQNSKPRQRPYPKLAKEAPEGDSPDPPPGRRLLPTEARIWPITTMAELLAPVRRNTLRIQRDAGFSWLRTISR
jgi:hypothetical protein